MEWVFCFLGINIFVLIIFPYAFYDIVAWYFSNYIGVSFIFHITLAIHMLTLLLYLQWVPKESKWFRTLPVWQWFRKHYFGFRIIDPHKSMETQSSRIYAVHPHGLYPMTIISYFANNANLLHIKPVATSLLFRVPLVKEVSGLAGVIPANRVDILTTLQCGDSVVMCPGGIRETFKDPIVVKREGFIKISRATNTPIVPVWSPTENALYKVWIPFPRIQGWLLSIFLYPCGVFAFGAWWMPFLPKVPKEMPLYIGKTLYPENYETVDEMVKAFYEELEKLSQ